MQLVTKLFMQVLVKRGKQIGLWASLCGNFADKVTAPAGYDWALIDMERSPNNQFSVLGKLQAFVVCSRDASLLANSSNEVLAQVKGALS